MSQEEKKDRKVEKEKDPDKEEEEKEEDNNKVLASDPRTSQRVLWDLSCLVEPAEGLQHVTIDGLDYILIREGVVLHTTEKELGYCGYPGTWY